MCSSCSSKKKKNRSRFVEDHNEATNVVIPLVRDESESMTDHGGLTQTKRRIKKIDDKTKCAVLKGSSYSATTDMLTCCVHLIIC